MLGFKKNKKVVEMSLNLIIMLIIGLTILGLIIGLVISKKSNAEEIFQQGLDALDTHTKERLEEEPGVFVLSTPKVTVQKGKQKIIYAKFRNVGTESDIIPGGALPPNLHAIMGTLNAGGDFLPQAPPVSQDLVAKLNLESSGSIETQSPEIIVKANDQIVVPIVVIVDKNTPVGSTEFVTLNAGPAGKQILTVDVE